MVNLCEQCGCTCDSCSHLRLENQELKVKIQKMEELIPGSLKLCEELNSSKGKEPQLNRDLQSAQEQVKRLQDIYDEALKKTQELENKILQLAGELQTEKAYFEETVASMTEQLMNSVEKMNKLEKESIKNKRDCSLVVELLKCNQSLDMKFVSHKVDALPAELKDKVKGELDLNLAPIPEDLYHPPWSKKLWRSQSTSGLDTNANKSSSAKSRRNTFMNRRSKSTAIHNTPKG